MFPIVPCIKSHLPWKIHENPFHRFPVMLLTDRQTDRQTDGQTLNRVVFVQNRSRLIMQWLIVTMGKASCWRHQMEAFSALLALWQRSVTRSFDAFFDMRLNKRLSKQSWGWWCETPSCPLWRHWYVDIVKPVCNDHLYNRINYLWFIP